MTRKEKRARFKMLEVFAGKAGLTSAVAEICAELVLCLGLVRPKLADVDVSLDEDFEMLLEEDPDWIHGAPPCRW